MFAHLRNKQEKLVGLLVVGILLVGSMIYLGSYRYLFEKTTDAFAATPVTWAFDSSGDYTFDSSKVEVTGGVARLVTVDQTDSDNTSTGFGGGTHSNTQWDSSNNWLEFDATGQSGLAGNFTSRILDAGASAPWTTLAWTPRQPYFKELPDSAGADSGYATGTLSMTGNVGLWHFNESSWSGVANEVADSSGSANHCTSSGEASIITTGTLKNAGNFSTGGAVDFVNCGRASSLDFGTGNFSISAWINTTSAKAYNGIWGKGGWSNTLSHIAFATHVGYPSFSVGDGNTNYQYYAGGSSPSTINNGQWRHYVVVVERTGASSTSITPYVDGVLYGTARSQTFGGSGNVNSTSNDAFIGKIFGGDAFDGQIDEVAVFNRVLQGDEIFHMYKRGAVRIKQQVRSCAQSDCSDGTFIGPDGTASTYYTEYTTSTAGLPSKTLVNISDNRYFQYKTFFESNSTSYTPELSSVVASPAHYPGDSPTIVSSAGTPFVIVTGFTDSVASGTIKYQASNNSSNWYYWDGSNWAGASGYSQTNTTGEITAGLPKFRQQVGGGSFFFKAFLNSNDYRQLTQLNDVTLNRDTVEIKERTVVPSKITSIKLGDGSGVTKMRDIPIVIEGENILRFKVETDKSKLLDAQRWMRYEGSGKPFTFTLPEGEGAKTLYFRFMSWDGVEINDFTKTIVLDISAETVCTVPEAKVECAIPTRFCVPEKGKVSCIIPEWVCPKVPESVCNVPDDKEKGPSSVTSTPPVPFTTTSTLPVSFTTSTDERGLPINVEAPSKDEPTVPLDSVEEVAPRLEEGDIFFASSTKRGSPVYLFQNGKKRPFINDKIFLSWYESFDKAFLKLVNQEDADAIPLGSAVPYKQGSRLVKIKNSPKVYEVEENGRLCHIANEFKAIEKYGVRWSKMVDDISIKSFLESYFVDKKCK